jgi:uridine kinase
MCYIDVKKEVRTMADVLTIGIAGGTGSGKTTITRRIQRQFSDSVSVLYHDNYYKAHDELTYEERAKLNYDHPDAFDTDLLVSQLAALKRGEPVYCPSYDYTVHNRSNKTVLVSPAPVILVEGILILQSRRLCEQMDIKVFVDTDADVRILRRIVRDVRDRGRSLESVVNQYLTTVKPMHEQFVEPSRRMADIIIPEGGQNEVAMSLILERIRAHLNGGIRSGETVL